LTAELPAHTFIAVVFVLGPFAHRLCTLVRTQLSEAVGEAALVAVSALALLVPHAQSLFVEHVCGSEVLLAVRKRAMWVIASRALEKIDAKPSLAKVWCCLQLSARMREGAVVAKLASTLQVVQAKLRLVQL